MKKIFTLMTAALFALSMNAKQVVFDFSTAAGVTELGIALPDSAKGTDLSGKNMTKDSVTFTCAKVAKNDTRVWNSKNDGNYELRTYANNTFTFKCNEAINAIEFEGSAVSFTEFSGKSWTGAADSITFTATASLKITKITVVVGEQIEVWTPDTITASAAIALAQAGDAHDHFVIGVVKDQPFTTYAFKDKVSFWMHDAANVTDTIEFYDGLGKNNQKWASLEAAQLELRIGDTILVYAGGLSMYTPKESTVSFAEITGGYYAEKLGANPDAPEPIIFTPDTVTVAEAIEIGTALADNKTTDVEYVVKGYARSPKGPNQGYTDQTWYMADEPGAYGAFTAYQCQPDTTVMENDYMLVRGKIYKYVSDKGTTIEISKGTAVHGVAPAIDTIKVDVAGAMTAGEALEDNTTSEKFYQVTGYVVKPSEIEEGDTNQDFYLADEKDATFGAFKCYKAKIAFPGVAAGNKVAVFGKIKKSVYNEKTTIQMEYASVTIIEGQGVENVVLTEKAQKVMVDGVLYIIRDNKMYNVQGAQVR